MLQRFAAENATAMDSRFMPNGQQRSLRTKVMGYYEEIAWDASWPCCTTTHVQHFA